MTKITSAPRRWLIILPVIVLAVASYFVRVVHNPPGYYIDESSISYNAYKISQTGADEFGIRWPLYFRAFGDYKNPVYIYVLAGIYRVTGPSIPAARLFSATLGVLAAFALGLLGWRLTRKRDVALLVTLLTLLTPWLFEISRVVLEVSLYPLALALFLLAAHRASTRVRWSWKDVLSLATALALVTYTYSIGRLLGPLLALGLILFASRDRRSGLLSTWGLYILALIPIVIFNQRYPGWMGRFQIITYIEPKSTYPEIAWKFVKHFFGNFNPWRLFVTGDPNPEQIAHIYGTPLLLAATGILIVIGVGLLIRRRLFQEAWWRFVVYCLAVSVVPASLTKEYVHMLRLAPMMVFLIVLAIPALEWFMVEERKEGLRRVALPALVLLMVLQAAIFQWQFHSTANTQKRLRQFDNGYPEKIFARAVAMPSRPIYLADALAIPGYIQAYWNATLSGIPISDFVRIPVEPAPEGALVISTEETCPRCLILSVSEFYTLYQANSPPPKQEPLLEGGFRAALSLISAPKVVQAEEQVTLRVMVKNDSKFLWLGRERTGGRYQVSLGNHWLDGSGKPIINDDGRAAVLTGLKPGDQTELVLVVNAPKTPGDYLLELDMLQEEVSWFGLKGSPTLRVPVRVE